MYDYLGHNSQSLAIDTFGINDYILACGILPTGTGEWGSQIWLLAITESSDPPEPLPVARFTLSAINITAIVLVVIEILRRRRID
jgi:hypothetical protein